MARARIEFDQGGIQNLLQSGGVRSHIMGIAGQVQSEASATAQAAEQGSSRLAGYAAAGFSVAWEPRGKRPRAVVTSNAPTNVYLRVFISTAKNFGTPHFLAALYKFAPKRGR